ncbi:hypothetical protein [Streptomyces sp. NPDC056468]|uniref:hypothetical protein n=1 Tax=Streptomyces sp. NPDC056468 TaxID=3345830 RepID=UPI0036A01BDB
MACLNPTLKTPGLLLAYGPGDTGGRPTPPGVPFWVSPEIRLATLADAPGLIADPAGWEARPWNRRAEVGTDYYVLVRVRNTDPERERHFLNFHAWVCDYTLGRVGPATSTLPGIQQGFTGLSTATLPPHANLADPQPMQVIQSSGLWTPTEEQRAKNGGHFCLGVVVWAEADTGSTPSTPQDGFDQPGGYLDPTCDRRHGQGNMTIVPKPVGIRADLPIMLMVPVTDRCPLQARITLRPVKLDDGTGRLQRVPELEQAAEEHGIPYLTLPEGTPFDRVGIGRDAESAGRTLTARLDPGDRLDLNLAFDGWPQEKPGDVYAVDVLTTDTVAKQRYGAARTYVLVTDRR